MDKDALMRRISAATDSKNQPANKVNTARDIQSPSAVSAGAQNLGQQNPILHRNQSVAAPNRPQPAQRKKRVLLDSDQAIEPDVALAPPSQATHQRQHPSNSGQSHLGGVSPAGAPPAGHSSPLGQQVGAAHFDPIAELNLAYGQTAQPEVVAEVKPLMSFKPEPNEEEAEDDKQMSRQPSEERPEAHIIACDGSIGIVQGDTSCVDTLTGLTWAVGRMLSIHVGDSRVVGMICDINIPEGHFSENSKSILHFKVELQGEVRDDPDSGKTSFAKGISSYPGVGSVVHQIRAKDLSAIYAATGTNNGVIGSLSQDESIPAFVDIPDMLSKHFAVLGSTGSGKSASVSLLLHCAQELVPDLRTVILDPHNEYSIAFPSGNTISQADLDLPFWMFQLEEYVEVLFRGKPVIHEEVDALREFIPIAMTKFRDGEDRVNLRSKRSSKSLTADSSVPYRLADLLLLIDDEMGLLESQFSKSALKSLKARISAQSTDARYAFMFRHRTIEDIAQRVVGNFFCLPGNGSLTTIIQMAGMPAEVVNSVASVLCRLSFELAIAAKGNLKVLVVCEEAHRYVPAGKGGFEPTRRAIARIAKEGRKYGSFIAIISQRPSELDPTILSQCSTVFSLRLTNDFDQDIIRRAISSSSASTIAFISSLANRECIAFGEGMSTPMRLKFRNLPKAWLPGAEADVFGNPNPILDAQQSDAVFQSWRATSA